MVAGSFALHGSTSARSGPAEPVHGPVALLATCFFAPGGQAAILDFVIDIDNAQSQAAGHCLIGSSAQGSGTATLDTNTLLFSWDITMGNNAPSYDNGLLDQGAELVAHFHRGQAGMNGETLVVLNNGSPKVGSTTVSAAEAEIIKDDGWYVNIHSAGCDPGEIRGQVLRLLPPPVPVGAAPGLVVALLASGAWALVGRRSGPPTA